MLDDRQEATERRSRARDRILDAAYELFSHRGIRAVGVNEVIERAGVATATLYRHFHSKDDLVLAFLDLREQRWTRDLIEAGAMRRGSNPEERLLAIFDVLDDWFHVEDFDAGSFIKVLLELGPKHPAGDASVRHLEELRAIVRRLAEQAGLRGRTGLHACWRSPQTARVGCDGYIAKPSSIREPAEELRPVIARNPDEREQARAVAIVAARESAAGSTL